MQSYQTLDEALTRTTMALGTALVQWQFIETAMFGLYAHLCGQSDQRAINLIYHSMSLETKTKAITKLVKYRASDLVQEWDNIRKAMNKQKELRDKLAHWTVMSGLSKDGGYISYLAPPTTDDHRIHKVISDPDNSEAISAEVLKQRSISDFQRVGYSIVEFQKRVLIF